MVAGTPKAVLPVSRLVRRSRRTMPERVRTFTASSDCMALTGDSPGGGPLGGVPFAGPGGVPVGSPSPGPPTEPFAGYGPAVSSGISARQAVAVPPLLEPEAVPQLVSKTPMPAIPICRMRRRSSGFLPHIDRSACSPKSLMSLPSS